MVKKKMVVKKKMMKTHLGEVESEIDRSCVVPVGEEATREDRSVGGDSAQE